MIRWCGGKRKLSSSLISSFPPFGEFREPFMGGSAFARHIDGYIPKWLNDKDPLLANFWLLMQSDDDFFHRALELPKRLYSAEKIVNYANAAKLDVLRLRDVRSVEELRDKAQDHIELALQFAIGHRLAVKGQYGTHRGNNIFSINGAFLDRVLEVFTETYLMAERAALQNATITCGDYDVLLQEVNDSTFIFLDPPYMVQQKMYSYSWNREDHIVLAERLRQTKCKWMLTLEKSLFALYLYRQYEIEARKTEIVVRNYAA